jgi:type IV pilus assembly protein PilC
MRIFQRSLSMGDLIYLARSLRYSLLSGVMLRQAMELLASSGIRTVRPVAAAITRDLKAGWGLQDSLKKQAAIFPRLFVAMVSVGEESGNLPEVLQEVENYYVLQQKLRRDFRQEIAWPIVQLVAAILIIAALILILGIIAPGASDGRGEPTRQDPLGLGLVGTRGALIFLGAVAGTAIALWVMFRLLRYLLRGRPTIQRLLFLVPLIGPTRRSLALTRLCVALQFIMETGLSVMKTFRLAFSATDSDAFIAAIPTVEAGLRQGNSIAASMAETRGLFPEGFLSVVTIAEVSGRLPEMFKGQAEQFDDDVKRRLSTLNKIASGLVWVGIAGIIIFAIFRVFMNMYFGNIVRYLPK